MGLNLSCIYPFPFQARFFPFQTYGWIPSFSPHRVQEKWLNLRVKLKKYINFPWPGVDASKRRENDGSDAWKRRLLIEKTAQAILDARAKYPDSTLADLYDETFMPTDLRKAHQANDRAVMEAYGFDPKMTESQIVAELFRLYKELTHIGHGQ